MNTPEISQLTLDAFIDAALTKPIGLADIANFLGMSERETISVFRSRFSRTPVNYIFERRLTRARWLIQNTSMSLVAISLECGYNSQSYMSTCMKKYFGMSPRGLRMAARNDAQDYSRADHQSTPKKALH
ncbi:helix-turn-helix transcriptional regulator [Paraburkholderia tropica]|uniref:helix-turn-helix transcriptional regulator n=1 Tax=Paraburkholderia tropica TaxID=92647 RepID=UPI001CC59DEC|nr:helix-turn-helix transcriptional regulator [Paraburkholderia tropica]